MTHDATPRTCAAIIDEHFSDYQARFRGITQRAAGQFMARQWAKVRQDTTERVNLYAAVVDQAEADTRRHLQDRIADTGVWMAARADYAKRIAARADREVAETFFNSVTRRIFSTVGVDRRIEFVHDGHGADLPEPSGAVYRTYPLDGAIAPLIRQILDDFTEIHVDDEALAAVLPEVEARLQQRLAPVPAGPRAIDMLRPVFYRGQGAYFIGRVVDGDQCFPLVLALLHPPFGIVLDALLLDADSVSIVFSYTRSAFHVMADRPAELVGFLKSMLPKKPAAELFSAIGYFKHGKTVLYRDVCRHTAACGDEPFRISPGMRGMVMLVFDMTGHDMVLKLIRDRFDNPKKTSRERVMAQYDFVFKHYRVGRLIEAHAFEHLSFDACWFDDDLLDHLTAEAGQTVHLENGRVIIDHAYLERRVTPLDVYLREAAAAKTDAAVVDFGNAVKDLAMANIFPGDMLLKNFGVTRHGRVVFYDYDEIVPLTECRFRKIPQPRSYMEEMAAEPWYTVEENDVFPEELARFLGMTPRHRDRFLSHHADLLTPDFWLARQEEIRAGVIRHIRPYQPAHRLPAAT